MSLGVRWLVALLACAASVLACSALEVAAPVHGGTAPIRVENETDIPVGVYIDGRWLGTYPAGASAVAHVPQGVDSPVTVEIRSPSDAVLVSLPVSDAGLRDAAAGGYATGDSVGLPCGVLTVVVGTLEPDAALAPAASIEPGHCP